MKAERRVQERSNRSTQRAWEYFREHREKVSSAILGVGDTSRRPSLCVLGAGNCNDLDLSLLCARFERVTLVDLDAESVRLGVRRQRLSLQEQNQLSIEARDLLDVVELKGRYSAVLSCAVLSQLIGEAVRQNLSPREILGLRDKHLIDSVKMTDRGGTTTWVIDFVSSDTVPQLSTTPASDLATLTQELIQQRNFFHGTNPDAIDLFVATNAYMRANVDRFSHRTFWRWRLNARREYLVASWQFQHGA